MGLCDIEPHASNQLSISRKTTHLHNVAAKDEDLSWLVFFVGWDI